MEVFSLEKVEARWCVVFRILCCFHAVFFFVFFFFFSERILQERDHNDVDRNVKCPKKVNTSVAAGWFYWE